MSSGICKMCGHAGNVVQDQLNGSYCEVHMITIESMIIKDAMEFDQDGRQVGKLLPQSGGF